MLACSEPNKISEQPGSVSTMTKHQSCACARPGNLQPGCPGTAWLPRYTLANAPLGSNTLIGHCALLPHRRAGIYGQGLIERIGIEDDIAGDLHRERKSSRARAPTSRILLPRWDPSSTRSRTCHRGHGVERGYVILTSQKSSSSALLGN